MQRRVKSSRGTVKLRARARARLLLSREGKANRDVLDIRVYTYVCCGYIFMYYIYIYESLFLSLATALQLLCSPYLLFFLFSLRVYLSVSYKIEYRGMVQLQ